MSKILNFLSRNRAEIFFKTAAEIAKFDFWFTRFVALRGGPNFKTKYLGIDKKQIIST